MTLVTGAKTTSGWHSKKISRIFLVWRKKWLAAKREDFLSHLFGSLSLPLPDRKIFHANINTYHLDRYEHCRSPARICFSESFHRSLLQHMKKTFGIFKLPIILFRRFIIKRLVKMSPYY
jgi:hypothetical protein